MREEGEYDKSEYKERLAEIESGIAVATVSLNETKLEQLDIEATINYATNLISNLSRVWFDLSPELKPRFQKLIFPQGVSYDKNEKFQTTKLGLIYEIIQKKEAEKSSIFPYVDLAGIGPASRQCE